jgi:cardiolipin synthase
VPPPTAQDGVQVPKRRGSYGRATAGAIGIGSVVGAALTARRRLGAAEARLLGAASVLSAAIGIVALLWPRAVAVPIAILLIWIALSLFARAVQLHRAASKS